MVVFSGVDRRAMEDEALAMDTTRFFLIRHALVTPAARTMLYGSMDVALCEQALLEEAALYRWLAARLPLGAAWATSTLSRTRATAEAIFAAGYPKVLLTEEAELVEQHLGDWQGIRHEELVARLKHPAHPFWPHAGEEQPPGGEAFSDVVERVGPVLERYCVSHAGRDVVIVAHGGSIRAAVAHAMQLTPHQALSFSIRNLGLTRLVKQGADWQVAAVNEEPWAG